MTALVVRDADLHAHLLGRPVVAAFVWLAERLADESAPRWQTNACTLIEHLRLAGEPDAEDPAETVESVYGKCPSNLAERLLEAMGIYRAVGWTCLPPLLPLAHHLLQAELHLYVSLASGKPYRDHLAHQTRVAALAHLLLVPESPLPLPEPLRWESIRRRWSRTPEFQLLHAYALRQGLACPDPAQDGSPWDQVVPTAALLAGLVHDIGYVQKSLGAVSERVASTFRALVFPPQSTLDDGVDALPLGGLYRRTVSASAQGMRHAPMREFLARTYRDLHSVMGALWLARLRPQLARMLARVEEAPVEGKTRAGWFDLTLQLAAMMAFGHDLACASDAKRALLGLRKGRGGRDVLNFEELPLCTLFALADVTQEFGRPVHVIDPETRSARFVVPIAGLRLERLAGGERTRKQGAGLDPAKQSDLLTAARLWDLPALEPCRTTCLYLSYVTREDDSGARLFDEDVTRLRGRSDWEEWRVGSGQAEWLVSAGLGDWVRLDGDPSAAKRVEARAKRLGCVLDAADARPVDKKTAKHLLQRLDGALGGSARGKTAVIRERVARLRKANSTALPWLAPLAAGAPPGLRLPAARRSLAGRPE